MGRLRSSRPTGPPLSRRVTPPRARRVGRGCRAPSPRRTASRRLATCSLDSTAETWWSTVLVEMNSRCAISALVDPSASRREDLDLAAGEPGRVRPRGLAPTRRDGRGAAAPQVLAHLAGDPVGAEPIEHVEPGARALRRAGVDEGQRLVVRRGQLRPGRRGVVEAARRAAAGTARRRRPARAPRSVRSQVGVEPAEPRREVTAGPLEAGARRRRRAALGTRRAGRRRRPAATTARPARRPPAAAGSARRTGGPAPTPPRGRRRRRRPGAAPPDPGRGAATSARAGRSGPASTSSASATASAQSPRMSFIRPREPSCHTRQIGRSRSIVSGRLKPSSSAALPEPPLLDVEVGQVAVAARVDLVEVLVAPC